MNHGKVQEWLNWHAWKACIPQGIEGSNPSLSATNKKPREAGLFYFPASQACMSEQRNKKAMLRSSRLLIRCWPPPGDHDRSEAEGVILKVERGNRAECDAFILCSSSSAIDHKQTSGRSNPGERERGNRAESDAFILL